MRIDKLNDMLEAIEKERGIPTKVLKEAVEAALLSACKKKFQTHEHLKCIIAEDGEAKIFAQTLIVEEVTNQETEISLTEAKKTNKTAALGETVDIDVTPKDFGRVAAQTAKQVIIQRIREAEKDKAFEEFSQKSGDLITGTVQRQEDRAYLINLGRVETMLVPQEQIRGETFRIKDHVKLFVTEVKKTPRGPLVMVSRSNPGLVAKLFELEVPEISQGVLEIKGIAREAGRRTKIAVHSTDKNVTAVGTCVGHMGNRIQNIVRELGNERVDIIEWKNDPVAFITNSLSPAKISQVILNKEQQTAKVIVPSAQLSLSIGKEGQNVRLASKLTGWKIDICSDEDNAKATAPQSSGKAKDQEPEKIKIHELAKEVELTSKEVLAKLKELKIEAKVATSAISAEDKQKFLESLNEKTGEKTKAGFDKEKD